MEKYIEVKSLIDALEQRKKQLSLWVDKDSASQRIDEIDGILDVDIVSLQQEQQDVDLEEEITNFIQAHYHIRYDNTLENGNDLLTVFDFEDIARHFAKWGAEHLKK